MKNRFAVTVLLLCLAVLICVLLCNCDGDKPEKSTGFKIASWNVQNIFDSTVDGTEYTEYTRSSGWNHTSYMARLSNAADVLNSKDLSDAGIIVLNEVENAAVAQDLMALLKGRDFLWYAVAKQEDSAISIAVISSIPMKDATVHRVEGTRPVVSVRFEIDGKSVHVLAVHAKSNLGDAETDIELRQLLGSAVMGIVSSIRSSYPDSLILLAGDFNEDPWDGNVVKDAAMWRCFWDDNTASGESMGSYFYDGVWHCYDNILLSADMIEDWGVVTDGIVTDIEGHPNRWNRNTLSGVSDHLPVWVRVKTV